MPSRKRGGNPEEAGIPPRLKKDGYLPEIAFCVSGRYTKKLTKGEKRVAPSPPENRLPKKGKGGISPSYAAATRGQIPKRMGNGSLWKRRKKKERRRKRFLCPLRRSIKQRGSCRGALRPPGRAMLSGCRRRMESPTPTS